MRKQEGFIASLLIFVVLVAIILWAATNYFVPQAREKCIARYGQGWEPVFQGDFLCKNANGDLKSIR